MDDLGVYNPTEHMWYQKAAAARRLNANPRMGFPHITPANNEFTKGGSIFVRVSQAIYSKAGKLIGVIGAYATTDALSERLATGLADLESADVIIEKLGEVVGSSDRLVTTRTTTTARATSAGAYTSTYNRSPGQPWLTGRACY